MFNFLKYFYCFICFCLLTFFLNKNVAANSNNFVSEAKNRDLTFSSVRSLKSTINQFEYFFGEDQSRYIVEVEKENLKKVEEIFKKNSVHFDEIGEISNDDLTFDDKTKVSIDELYISNNNWLTNYMSK